MRLRTENLPEIVAEGTAATPSRTITVPDYDRSGLTAGIVHFGVGGFHRAHQAVYLDDLLKRGEARDFAICGMGVMPGDRRMRDVLRDQDHLYTLLTRYPDGREDVRVIGSIIDYIWVPEDLHAALDKLADPSTQIVSLTVTEGGYNFNQVTGEYDLAQPAVAADIDNPHEPSTVFGLIVEALRMRRKSGIEPFTVMSCDNIQGNGDLAKAMFTAHAAAVDQGLGDWIRANVAFPNSMVDRITPATTEDDVAYVRDQFGYDDQWPVVTEHFLQWVLEDSFTGARPAYEKVGVQVVEDVTPYEKLKLRLLNASHQGLCYFGHLAGYHLVDQAASDPLIADFLLRYMREEAMPTLDALPDTDVEAYAQELLRRFTNASVKDTVPRLCAESSDRIPKWLVPVILDNLRDGGQVDLSAAIVASWARYAEGTDENGQPIRIIDNAESRVRANAQAQLGADELAFLREPDFFAGLADEPRFTEPYLETLRSLHQIGASRTLRAILARDKAKEDPKND